MRWTITASAAVLLLAATACGSDSGPASEGTTKPAAGGSPGAIATSPATPTPPGSTAAATATAGATATSGAPSSALPLLGSVKSADGSAQLDVPVGSLPAGLRVEDIKVAAVDPATLPVTFPDGPALAAYTLEPDGARFLQPVILTVTLPGKDGFLPSAVMVSGNEVSAALDMEVTLDAESETLTVSTKLDHFSNVIYHHRSFFWVPEMKFVGDQVVGGAFVGEAKIGVVQSEFQLYYRGTTDPLVLVKLTDRPRLTGLFSVVRGPVVPTRSLDKPRDLVLEKSLRVDNTRGGVQDDTYYTFKETYQCTRPGLVVLEYEAYLSYSVEYEWASFRGLFSGDASSGPASLLIKIRTVPFQCKTTLPTVTPVSKQNLNPNSPPENSAINAVLTLLPSGLYETTYSLVMRDPNGDVMSPVWERLGGESCGSGNYLTRQKGGELGLDPTVVGEGEFQYVWLHSAHREPWCHPNDVGEPHPVHAETVIKVTITDGLSNRAGRFSVTCFYTGVASGRGPACDMAKRVAQ